MWRRNLLQREDVKIRKQELVREEIVSRKVNDKTR